MEALLDEYGRILKELKFDSFNHNEDKYSGVFLPVPFDEYWSSSLKPESVKPAPTLSLSPPASTF